MQDGVTDHFDVVKIVIALIDAWYPLVQSLVDRDNDSITLQ